MQPAERSLSPARIEHALRVTTQSIDPRVKTADERMSGAEGGAIRRCYMKRLEKPDSHRGKICTSLCCAQYVATDSV
jgi:hypothetical protein